MTAALEGGEWSAARPGRILPQGKTRYPFYRRLGGSQGRSGRAENLVPTRIRSQTVQPVAQSLYRLSYRPTNNNNNNYYYYYTVQQGLMKPCPTSRRIDEPSRALASTKWHLPEKRESKTFNFGIEAMRYHTTTDFRTPFEALINEEGNQQTQNLKYDLHTESVPRHLVVPRHNQSACTEFSKPAIPSYYSAHVTTFGARSFCPRPGLRWGKEEQKSIPVSCRIVAHKTSSAEVNTLPALRGNRIKNVIHLHLHHTQT